jgi:hypothetical protein
VSCEEVVGGKEMMSLWAMVKRWAIVNFWTSMNPWTTVSLRAMVNHGVMVSLWVPWESLSCHDVQSSTHCILV